MTLPGVAPIKPEYIIPSGKRGLDETEESLSVKAITKNDRKRGQNKDRPLTYSRDAIDLCPALATGLECVRQDCKMNHDIQLYLESKEPDIGDVCPVYEAAGECKYGIKCRFAKCHTEDGKQLKDFDKIANYKGILNVVDFSVIKAIRSKKMDLPRSKELKPLFQLKTHEEKIEKIQLFDIKKKRVDFRGKTYLAPLTTVGNLPFRRICKSFGVDITCGEMAVASALLNGVKSEWALLRRHPSEDLFGVQIAGSNPLLMTEAVEAISLNCSADFIDLNMGCPVDLVAKHGAGSSLLERKNKTEEILMGMNFASEIAHTVKIRTGISSKNVAHTLLDIFKRNNVSLVTLHGRSREQRYTKLANWDYISECANQVKESNMNFFGNGDVLGWEDYYARLESGVDGVMIGRGALIKPWIFKEIKERKVYDISSRERLDILRDFAHFGLEHWGSDTLGVNATRRFMCEWLSFLCRYIPVGLLEVLPQKMNERPPNFRGRDEMETLLASNNSKDWVKITELFLGPAPNSFQFTPKHKSNSYSD